MRTSIYDIYNQYNRKYFSGKLPTIDDEFDVRFGRLGRDNHGETNFYVDFTEIVISTRLVNQGRFVRIILLHEMCHVALPASAKHGPRFMREIKRIMRMGAFDDLVG
jgi:predicted metal-dependent hydrolase